MTVPRTSKEIDDRTSRLQKRLQKGKTGKGGRAVVVMDDDPTTPPPDAGYVSEPMVMVDARGDDVVQSSSRHPPSSNPRGDEDDETPPVERRERRKQPTIKLPLDLTGPEGDFERSYGRSALGEPRIDRGTEFMKAAVKAGWIKV